jgi:hypothetical protein
MLTPDPPADAAPSRVKAHQLTVAVLVVSAGVLGVILAATTSPTATASPGSAASRTASPTASPAAMASPAITVSPSPRASASASASTSAPVTASVRSDRGALGPCRPGPFFKVEFADPKNFYVPRTHYVDGPGGDIRVWVKQWHTVKFDVHLEREVQTEFHIQDFIARMRKEINPEIDEEHTVESGHEYHVTISKKMYGHVRYRVFGYKVGFQQWRVLDNCGMLKVVSGIASVPTRKEGWQYWESRSP